MKKLLPVRWHPFPRPALPMACLRMILFVLSCPLWLATPGFAQDVLWGLTNDLGPEGAGTAFSVGSDGADFTVRKAFAIAPFSPLGSLVEGRDGYFYGVTQNLLNYREFSLYNSYMSGVGAVFKVSPAGAVTVLRNFSNADGMYPVDGLVEGRDGNFYGMTYMGGNGGGGTIYKISPTGAFALLHNFNYSHANGSAPLGSLVEGSDGNLYGMTSSGGSSGGGTIFRISPTGAFALLHSFDYANDGGYPSGSLV
ncbi:MAG TPA: choice-of-anchor tandem repeat GloVer-containing protein, partial [Cytophagales bacterium]